jgi:formylglycine-generating enzyme required for sulfatase activity
MPRQLSILLSSLMIFGMIQLECQVRGQSPKGIINSIGMQLVLIPKGTFQMGSPVEDTKRESDEEQHEVTISKDYYLGMTEITQGQYEEVMGTNPSQDIRNRDSSMHPVDNVSWDDAIEFCKKLSEFPWEKKAGRVYRLPTEAEWEYACRAGSRTRFSCGDSLRSIYEHAWYGDNSGSQTNLVGQKKPNPWGLYDMHGNVSEWCSDWYGDYPKGACTDPTGARDSGLRVVRGGSRIYDVSICRSAKREWRLPWYSDLRTGFRVALNSESKIPK